MLTLGQLRDWIKMQMPELRDCIAVGSIDGNKDKFVGVYPLKLPSSMQRICLGGEEQTGYQERGASILLHWTKNVDEAEQQAMELYRLFYGSSRVVMGDNLAIKIDPGAGPIPVGKDKNGVSEFVVQIKITYERI
ncbi:phage tail terminator protein [Clostridium merdae]|uniref:phage tail terminator protein n=1 Tax=Clostridium merdae TaxID=1958780 RepID=UPI000A26871F|nr:minor capsid protein [Clostridium merdae]